MSLCALCRQIDINGLVPYCSPEEAEINALQLSFAHHRSYVALEKSAASCPLCRLMIDSLVQGNPDRVIPEDISTTEKSEIWLISGGEMFYDLSLPKRLSQIRVNIGDSKWMKTIDLGLYASEDDPLAISEDVIGRLPEPHAYSPKTLLLMKSWLHGCMTGHHECQFITSSTPGSDHNHFEETPLPTRLLQLLPDGSIKLYESNGRAGHYIALSYCWGKSQPFITLRKSYEALKTGFLVEDLPKTLRDAIKITLALGFSFLWIDALCIVQDDIEDWQRESTKMGSVYANAVLTIAATDATDTSIGFLIERPHIKMEPIKLTSKCSDGSGSGVMSIYPKPGNVNDILDRSPLNSRGWCLQERILSRRVLHFARDQMYWECQRCSLAEDRTMLGQIHSLKRELFLSHENLNQTSTNRMLRAWHNLVTDYSERNLTKSSDMFPAISGLARQISQWTSSAYHAGLWAEDLPLGLLWSTRGDPSTAPCADWRAPTWSWASIVGAVISQYRTSALILKPVFETLEVVDVNAPANGLNRFGEITQGSMQVRGKLKRASRASSGRSYGGHVWELQLPILDEDGRDIGDLDFDNRKTVPPMKFDVLLVCAGLFNNLYRCQFLVLQETTTPGQFVRIGVGTMNHKYFEDTKLQNLAIV